MPNFSSFTGTAPEKKLSKEEMIRALRFSIVAEYEAIEIYKQFVESSDNFLFRRVMNDVINEEKIHAGEFLRVLFELAPDEKEFYDKGFDEVQNLIKKPSKL